MSDLSTSYLGLALRSPLVASASPLTEDLDNIRRLEDAGAAAIVFHSLFEEQLTLEALDLDHFLDFGAESFVEAQTYFPDMTGYNRGPEAYLDQIRQAKGAVAVPIIGSLNGISAGGWLRYARLIEEAGADALELNVYVIPTDPEVAGVEVEQRLCDLVREVRAAIRIPLAVKLCPFFTAPANLARLLDRIGVNALVLFNRFYQPDFDVEALEVTPSLSLSTPQELLLRLHWVAILFGSIRADLAVTGGVHSARHVLQAMMAGANVAMMTSALLKHGIDHLKHVQTDLERWMDERGYESIRQMQGSMSYRRVANPAAFERANYMKVLRSYALHRTGG